MTVMTVMNGMRRLMGLNRIHTRKGLADCFREMGDLTLGPDQWLADPNNLVPQSYSDHAANRNGGCTHSSHDYDFDEVDAQTAVRLAEVNAITKPPYYQQRSV